MYFVTDVSTDLKITNSLNHLKDMKIYNTGIMSAKIELLADSKDEAIAVSILYFMNNAPIAVYDCDEESTLSFPYSPLEIDKILWWMWDKMKESYASIKKISN